MKKSAVEILIEIKAWYDYTYEENNFNPHDMRSFDECMTSIGRYIHDHIDEINQSLK